jgi:mono/diheme cytochrome c family protein
MKIALGLGLVLVVTAADAVVQVRSQRILETRHPLPPSAVSAATTPEAIAEGGHLVQVAACSLCHGRDLAGTMIAAAGSPVYAPNLTLVVKKRSDAALDRAIRSGLRPDGTSELGMPSHAYARFTDAETAAILGYLRSLGPQGALKARPSPGFLQRADLAAGILHPEVERVASARTPLDVGPGFETGRHLASVACAQCHGTDLSGGHGAPGTDLMVRGDYDRAQFHALMRKGESRSGHDLELMSSTARASFSHFSDAEIDAIYDYLNARDLRLAGPPKTGG